MYFALYCILFGILVFPPETDGSSLTWLKPMPVQVVSSTNRVEHQNQTRLIEGTINASLIWHFKLSSELTFVSLTLVLDGAPVASETGVFTQFRDKYAVNLVQSSEIIVTLVIFEVTAAHDTIFSCEVFAREQGTLTWKSNVQVDVFGPPRTIFTSSGRISTPPAVLTLNCSADAKPDANITWTRVSDSTVVTMPLNITGVENGGSYRCTADNGFGKPLTKDVFVDVQFSPMVGVHAKVFVQRKQTAFLICKVEGNPAPIISWSPCPEKNVCDERYLNISKVQTTGANYTCKATNPLGVDSATTVVVIGGKDVFLSMSVSGECHNQDFVWKILQKELVIVFTNFSQNYSGAVLINVRCGGSLIFNVHLRFSTNVAEDDIISMIQNAIVDGKLGELRVNVTNVFGIAPPTTTAATPTSTIRKSDDNTGLIIGAVLGSVAFVALIVFIIWCVRKKNCCSDRKEVSDNTDAAQGRKGKGPNGADEVAYASTSMLPNSKRQVEKTNQSTAQALPMYAQVDKTKKTSNKGGVAQRQPGDLQYAEVEHVTSGRSLPRKSSSEPIKPSNEEIVYADLV